MKKIGFIVLLFCLINTHITVGQMQKIRHNLFDFEIGTNYTISRQDATSILLVDTIQIDSLTFIKRLYILKMDINLQEMGIYVATDLFDLDRFEIVVCDEVSTTFCGITNIGGRDVRYIYYILEIFSDHTHRYLIGYFFSLAYYFIESGRLYRIRQSYHFLNPSNKNRFDRHGFLRQIRRHMNTGDLNYLITNIRIRE